MSLRLSFVRSIDDAQIYRTMFFPVLTFDVNIWVKAFKNLKKLLNIYSRTWNALLQVFADGKTLREIQPMRAANSDFLRCSMTKARQNYCLPPASAGNGQLRIMSIHYWETFVRSTFSYHSMWNILTDLYKPLKKVWKLFSLTSFTFI